MIVYGINLLEDARSECLFVETQSSSSEDFIMGPVMPAPLELEDGDQAMIDDLVKVNLGTEEDFHRTFISACLSLEEQTQYFEFLRKN